MQGDGVRGGRVGCAQASSADQRIGQCQRLLVLCLREPRSAPTLAQAGTGRGEGDRHRRSHAATGRQYGNGESLLRADASGSCATTRSSWPATTQGAPSGSGRGGGNGMVAAVEGSV